MNRTVTRILALTILILAAIALVQNQSASAAEGHDYIRDVRGTASTGFILDRVSSTGVDYTDAWYPAWLQKDRCRANLSTRAARRACVADVRANMEWARTVRASIRMARSNPAPVPTEPAPFYPGPTR